MLQLRLNPDPVLLRMQRLPSNWFPFPMSASYFKRDAHVLGDADRAVVRHVAHVPRKGVDDPMGCQDVCSNVADVPLKMT